MLKSSLNFKLGDSIKIVNTETKIRYLENRVARIVNIFNEENELSTLEVEWDSETLKNLNRFDLLKLIKEDEIPFYGYLSEKFATKIEARDSIEELEITQDIIEKKILKLAKEYEDKSHFRFYIDKWLRRFIHTPYYLEVPDSQKEFVGFIVDSFSEKLYDVEDLIPPDWNIEALEEICLTNIPKSIVLEETTIEQYYEILMLFFKFLDEKKLLETKELQKSLEKNLKIFCKAFKSKTSWGILKTIQMKMIKDGFKLDDDAALQKYIEKYNENIEKKNRKK